jgi:hypothetical protein
MFQPRGSGCGRNKVAEQRADLFAALLKATADD